MSAPIHEIVNLHQVDHLGAQQLGRAPHLFDAAIAACGPHLGRDKGSRPRIQFSQKIAGDRLGPAVHRRAVDHPPAAIEQQL